MRQVRFLVWALVAGLAVQAWGQGFWSSREYTRWSRRDVSEMLQGSPWAKRITLRRAVITMLGADRPEDINVPGRVEPEIFYQVQFRSAPPIRQALVRQRQMASDYEKMDEEQQKAFDDATANFLNVEFPDTIVVYVEYGSNVAEYDRLLAYHWQNLTGDLVRGEIYLIAGGERIALLDYLPLKGSGRGFQLTFPRRKPDGSPTIPAGERRINLEFFHPTVGPYRSERLMFSFDSRRMMVSGKQVY